MVRKVLVPFSGISYISFIIDLLTEQNMKTEMLMNILTEAVFQFHIFQPCFETLSLLCEIKFSLSSHIFGT